MNFGLGVGEIEPVGSIPIVIHWVSTENWFFAAALFASLIEQGSRVRCIVLKGN